MSILIYIAAAVQIIIGGMILRAAESALHEITAAIAIGFGIVSLALARLLQYREAEVKARDDAARSARMEERKTR